MLVIAGSSESGGEEPIIISKKYMSEAPDMKHYSTHPPPPPQDSKPRRGGKKKGGDYSPFRGEMGAIEMTDYRRMPLHGAARRKLEETTNRQTYVVELLNLKF